MSNEVSAPELNAVTPQCQFFVQRKKRLCRMTVKPGRRYCGEHEPQPTTEAGEVDKRIPCPNDPKHTCYASKLVKHLAVCNARRTQQPAYIVENINAPEAEDSKPRTPLSAVPREALVKLIDKVNHLYAKYLEDHITEEPPQPIHHAVAADFAEPDRAESSRRHLRQASALLWLAEREGLVRDNTCYVELGAGKGQLSYYACHAWCGGTRAGRVLAVDRAPLRHKRDNKLRSHPPGGRHAAAGMHQDSSEAANDSSEQLNTISDANEKANGSSQHNNKQVDEVDTHTSKHADANKDNNNMEAEVVTREDKAKEEVDDAHAMSNGDDSKMEPVNENITLEDETKVVVDTHANVYNKDSIVEATNEDGEVGDEGAGGSGDEVASRLRADLAHLALAAVPAVAASSGVVGLAKHLCGVATDYALRCVAAPGVLRKTHGLVLATCCHHRCQRAAYVGTPHLQELGIDSEEFDIMLGVVSWATCGDGRSRERRAAPPAQPPRPPAPHKYPITREERSEVGRRAKALLDYGRALWLRARGLRARLTRVVPAAVSPENLAIVASTP